VRIGALVGTSIALVVHLALGAWFWSGADFHTRDAEQANLFCSYPDSATAAYREPSVCTNDADPCMKDGTKLTLDDFVGMTGSSTAGQALWNISFTGLFLAYVVAMLGLVIKNKMISKIAAGLIVLVIVIYTVCWILGWSTGPQYTELEGAERQYWHFWKFAYCNNTDPSTGKAYTDFPTVRDARIESLKSNGIEPLHAMDHETHGPVSAGNDPLWCSSVPADPAFGASMWRQPGTTGAADTYAECPSEETGVFFPTGALVFFILLWILNVPLQVWNVFAVWQAANEFGKAPEGKASAQGQA
jgi:hypothetical protein